MNLFQAVMARLEADKKNYRHLFYDHKQNEFRLVKESYKLLPRGTRYLIYFDGNIWGQHILLKRAAHWEFIGYV